MKDKYGNYSDEELVAAAQTGDEDAGEFLIRRYKDVVRKKAHLYFMAGADNEDVVQEGMIGIFKAIKGYDHTKEATFRTFAEICINRQIITAIKMAGRLKHSPLNTSVSLNRPISDTDPIKTLEETLSSTRTTDPEELFLMKENMDYIEGKGNDIFSDFELKVWNEYLQGKTYLEIAKMMDKTPKAIDNAIQRTKRKLELYIRR
ncbi:MAG: RNA polymerase sporulation sigma factor SigH [Anaerovoracaceae bacterium]|jgi:RNA polymerase sporulation-specific sigma factor